MLIWIGALVSVILGYRLHEWWVPTVVACAVVAVQAVAFRTLMTQGGGWELLVFSLAINLLVFHAVFGIGRAIRQRFNPRKGSAP